MSTSPYAERLGAALLEEDLDPARAARLVTRIARILKRRRAPSSKAIKPIARNRKAVRAARTELAGVLAPFLAKQARAIAHQVTSVRNALGKLTKADGVDPDLQSVVDAVLEQLNLDWGDLTPDIQEIIIRIATDGVAVAFDQIGVDPSAPTNIDVLQQANKRAIEYATDRAGELVTQISESTREMVRSDVTTALEEGMSSEDLADALEARYAFSADRADTIARTELATADVQGNLAAYRASGVVSGKEWVLGSEHDEMDECDDAADLGVVDLDDDFGGLGDPPAHPNCVCDVLPVLSDESDDSSDPSDEE